MSVNANSPQELLFDERIVNIFLQSQVDNSISTYLLIGINEQLILWLVKLDNDNLSEDFLNLLKYILPFGIKVYGILHFGLVDKSSFSQRTYSSYFLLKNSFPDYQVTEGSYYSIIIDSSLISSDNIHNIQQIECDGQEFKEKNKDLNAIRKFNKIKFINSESFLNENYLLISSLVNPLVVINKYNFLMNELYSNNIGLYFPDLNILVDNCNVEENSEEYQEFLSQNKQKVEEIKKNVIYKLKI
jgi:hypothetical protein